MERSSGSARPKTGSGLAPREEHRKFELAQTPDPVPVGSASVAHVCYFNVLKRINVGDRDLLAERDGFEPPVPRGLL